MTPPRRGSKTRTMRGRLKWAFLYLSKAAGLFHVSRYLTRRALRVLCYHSFTADEACIFRPQLFINSKTFEKRLEFLSAQGFPVLDIETALAMLDRGDLPDCATVITIDDGFYGVKKYAYELLNRFSFPATLYVTTYYCIKETPVFRLVIQYMFWKATKNFLDISDLDASLSGRFYLDNISEKDKAVHEIIHFGEEQCNEQKRFALMKELGMLLGVDFEQICEARILSLLTRDELRALAINGMDIQLHTHRHRLPLNEQEALQEITDNKTVLNPLARKPLRHFCYPSGVWSRRFWPWLTAIGIKSAVTCEPGLNYPETPKLGLKRFLDGEHISQIEFEAEMTGYNELLRRLRSQVRRLLP